MASSTTQAIATRIPNELADHLRREADRDGTTVSAVARQCIRLALTGNTMRPSHDDHRSQRDDATRIATH